MPPPRIILSEASHLLRVTPSFQFPEQRHGHMPHFSSSEPTRVNMKTSFALSSNASEIRGLLPTTLDATTRLLATKVQVPWPHPGFPASSRDFFKMRSEQFTPLLQQADDFP